MSVAQADYSQVATDVLVAYRLPRKANELICPATCAGVSHATKFLISAVVGCQMGSKAVQAL